MILEGRSLSSGASTVGYSEDLLFDLQMASSSLCPHMVGRDGLSCKGTGLIMKASFSWPHGTLIIFHRPCLHMLSQQGLRLQHVNSVEDSAVKEDNK
jgi:hypothetical protein